MFWASFGVGKVSGVGVAVPGVRLGALIVDPTSYRSQSEPVLLF